MALRPPAPLRAVAVLLVAAVASGCASDPPTVDPTGVDLLEIPTPSPDPDDFVSGIDNRWLPLTPGSEWVYESTDGETITVTVTDETRLVAGVRTTVVRDVVTGEDGEVVEETSDWFAQDVDGNVWYFGEETTEYDDRGRPDTAGSWEAGVDGAEAGVVMLAEPRRGDGYQQEHLAGEAEDRATVLSLDESLQIDSGSYDGLLVTEETTPLEPGLVEHKYYAPGLGLVLEQTVAGDGGEAELVGFTEAGAAR
ncbi:hypothetical protein [Nocardioides euryhalodurans]|uniref:Uncharacterized protein n=1 Tax=Nocardioides euryhalodurans TaxID=2518370 RepID=A0A4P7GJM9_9ACTN|nr:hypothetical protein [Nocardioides euryhalodurans]QBR92103.1 hypothetical protein EXE57_07275 [Nocardioides euryhalodurans]